MQPLHWGKKSPELEEHCRDVGGCVGRGMVIKVFSVGTPNTSQPIKCFQSNFSCM